MPVWNRDGGKGVGGEKSGRQGLGKGLEREGGLQLRTHQTQARMFSSTFKKNE